MICSSDPSHITFFYGRRHCHLCRSFREQLETFTSELLVPAGVLSFTLQYIKTVKLLVKVWGHFLPPKYLCSYKMGTLDLLLGKLDRRLTDLRTRFIGLSKQVELRVLELILVTYILRLSKVEICCKLDNIKMLSRTISQVDSLLKDGSFEPSKFLIEVGNLSSEIHSVNGGSANPIFYKRYLEFFSLEQFVLCGGIRHIKAELHVSGNDFENPIHFVSGLPVCIPCQITLHNILNESRLWLRMRRGDESTQFLFLDLNVFERCDEVRRFPFPAPFYGTPKSVSFTLRLSIGMECFFEDAQCVRRGWGPKHELTYLCQEKEVYFSSMTKG